MKDQFVFQYNIPAENHLCNLPDEFITVVASQIVAPHVMVHPVIINNWVLRVIRDWNKAIDEMERIAIDHFNSLTEPEADLALQSHLS